MDDTSFDTNKLIIVIAGPTAVGKSDVALKLASYYNCHIFSADSRQLYKEMHIGTGKPSTSDLRRIKHYFIDHVSIFEGYSVGQYETEIKALLRDYFKEHKIAIICGGTGLYIKALLEGLDPFPDIPTEVLTSLDQQLEEKGLAFLQKRLEAADEDYFKKVDVFNARRVIRALSVIEVSGQTYTSFLQQKTSESLPYKVVKILLDLPRPILYEKINTRVGQMMQMGLLEEANDLLIHRGLRALETVGYQELFDHLTGKTDLDTAVHLIKQNSRRYAKRQLTWFRNQDTWKTFSPESYGEILAYIQHSMEPSIIS